MKCITALEKEKIKKNIEKADSLNIWMNNTVKTSGLSLLLKR